MKCDDTRGGLTAARLRQLLRYDRRTGAFYWRVTRGPSALKGARAGRVTNWGYRQIRIDGVVYVAQRLAHLYTTGRWPRRDMDHKNCRRRDNKWRNLRNASRRQNCHNRQVRSDSRSGAKCVYQRESGNWQAYIFVGGRNLGLGTHPSKKQAVAAYARAARRFFGKFARAA